STRYKAENRNADLVRTLEAALALGGGGGGAALHREAAERLRATGDERGALEHFVALLAIEPGDEDALDAVRAIARGVGDHKSLLRVLDGAAEAASGHAQYELTLEAAELARTDLGDVEGAVTRYHDALATTDASDADRAFVLRKLVRVFADAGRAEDELGALEKLMSVESELRDRKAVAGQAARAAERLGDMERAVAAWQFRLDADALDAEATDGLIGILEREGRHRELVDALVRRAKAHGSETAARTDWVRAANILARDLDDAEGSLEVWRSVIETFGEDAEAVDAMTELYARVEAWSDLATLLVRAAEREASHVAKVLNDAGHVQNERLEQPEEA
ncbi:MAG: hypothetical protein KC417_17940, partial [Myxococcales bacterium]|nr:hypothetical protein [Myxococcales bacterium]